MTEMVERVAAALLQRYVASQAVGAVVWEDMARVAILAMREPTEEMVAAMVRERVEFETGIGWTVMIDEALK